MNLAFHFGEEMYFSLKSKNPEASYDFICFVPQTEAEQEKRGYNQSCLLAEILGAYLEIPVYSTLVKLYDTKRQRTVSVRNKKGNVFGVFDTADGTEAEGKRILFVDDIQTSGATVDECAKMLKIRGAECVDVVVYAVTRKKENG